MSKKGVWLKSCAEIQNTDSETWNNSIFLWIIQSKLEFFWDDATFICRMGLSKDLLVPASSKETKRSRVFLWSLSVRALSDMECKLCWCQKESFRETYIWLLSWLHHFKCSHLLTLIKISAKCQPTHSVGLFSSLLDFPQFTIVCVQDILSLWRTSTVQYNGLVVDYFST